MHQPDEDATPDQVPAPDATAPETPAAGEAGAAGSASGPASVTEQPAGHDASETADVGAPEPPAAHDAGSDEVVDEGAPEVDDERTPDELREALTAAEAERDEYLTDLQRVQADFDNFRKRTMRDGTAQRSAGAAEVVTKLLDVVDDFDMALLSVDRTEDNAPLHKGIELVYGKLLDVFRTLGVERVDDTDVPFDPQRHEAVQSVEAEGDEAPEEPMVVAILRPGYVLGERVLRAAMVKVAK